VVAPPDLHEPTPKSVAAYVKRNAAKVKKTLAGMDHHGPAISVREADYKKHHIVITTSYAITIDEAPLMGHIVVTDEGQVQCHALPNYTFLSAVDMVKSLIDQFPEDFEASRKGAQSMPAMRGMSMKQRKPKARVAGKNRLSARKRRGRVGWPKRK
jgi:hypothetical protein